MPVADKVSSMVSEDIVRSIKKDIPSLDSDSEEKDNSLVFTKEDPGEVEPTHITSRDIKIEFPGLGKQIISMGEVPTYDSDIQNITEEQSESDIEIDVEK